MLYKLRKGLKKNKLANQLLTSYDFRTIFFSLISFSIGVAFAAYNIFTAIVSHSIWYGSLSAYYVFLGTVRAFVLFNDLKVRRTGKDVNNSRIKLYGICGILIVLMTLFLNSIVLHLVSSSRVYQYSDRVLYIVACYTLYRVIISVYNVLKANKRDNYTVRSLRNINLVTALVSLLSFQSAAVYAYSRITTHSLFNAITGFAVCAMIAMIGIFMMVSSFMQIKKQRVSEDASEA